MLAWNSYQKTTQLSKAKEKKSTFGKKKKPIKPKRNSNDKELSYLNYRAEVAHSKICFVCGCLGVISHHIKLTSSDKKDHKKLLWLCNAHHVGNIISPHGTPKKWRESYSLEVQLENADIEYREYLKIKGLRDET